MIPISDARRPRVLVVADRGFSSRAIEWWGGGGWSHFANVLADGSIIDARSQWVKLKGAQAIPPGVQRRPGRYLEHVPKWVLLEVGAEHHYTPWLRALEGQLGKPYDVEGIWNFVTGSAFDRNWRDESAWFCDELGIWAQEKAGICPKIPSPVYRLTPGAAFLFDLGLGARVLAGRG